MSKRGHLKGKEQSHFKYSSYTISSASGNVVVSQYYFMTTIIMYAAYRYKQVIESHTHGTTSRSFGGEEVH